MKQILKENGGLPASILWTLAIVAGISVANLYYNQPLLNMIRHELGVSEFETNLIAMATDAAMKQGAHAGNLIKAIAGNVGGGGGGRPNMAQAGGKNPAGIPDAIAQAKTALENMLK